MTAYAVVKYKATLLNALHGNYSTSSARNRLGLFNSTLREAVTISAWGTDYHLFVLSLLLNRPIIFYQASQPHPNLPNTLTVEQFAQRFLSHVSGTRQHCIACTNVHLALLSGGDISILPLLPLFIFHRHNHWVAMLPHSQSVMQHVPIPQHRTLQE